MSFIMSVNNEEIFTFYDKHKNLNFEEINLSFVELLEKSTIKIPTLNQTDIYKNIADKFAEISNKSNAEIVKRFEEFKNGYIQDLKMILTNNNIEKIGPLVKEHLENFQEKTKIKMYENNQVDIIKNLIIEDREKQNELQGNLKKLLENMGNSSAKGRIS